jgi:ABC-2 type transport system ATP-binding protein
VRQGKGYVADGHGEPELGTCWRVIETNNLTRTFGDITAVEGLTLRIDEGEVFGFLGPNGAGKTTTIRMLTCLISKTSGEARIGEYEVGNDADVQKIRKIIGLMPDNVGLYEDLSAYRNLDFYGRLYECTEAQRTERIEHFLRMLGLWEVRDRTVRTFSKGMKQKLAIVRALIHEPRVLFLDEPTANLDPEFQKTVRDFILELKHEKRTIFLNTHNLDEAQRICDRIGILNTRLVAEGTPERLMESLEGRKTEVQLQQVTPAIITAVERLGLNYVVSEGNKLLIGVSDPEEENPSITEAIVAAGGHIQFITERHATLEEVYLKLAREKEGR